MEEFRPGGTVLVRTVEVHSEHVKVLHRSAPIVPRGTRRKRANTDTWQQ